MKTCDPGQEATLVEVLANASTLLTDAQKAALTTELAKPVYSQMSTAQVLTALYGEQSVFVPAGARERLATWPETAEWLRGYQSGLLNGRPDLPTGIVQKWLVLLPNLLTQYPDSYTYTASTSTTIAKFAKEAIEDKVLPPKDVADFKAQFLEEQPEHAEIQPPVITLLVDGEGQRLFPPGIVLEPADVEECR